MNLRDECYFKTLITLHWLFMQNKILLKMWQPNTEKSLPPPPPLGGAMVIITPDTRWCPKLMMRLLQEFGPHERREFRIKRLSICKLRRHRWPQVKITPNKRVKGTSGFVCDAALGANINEVRNRDARYAHECTETKSIKQRNLHNWVHVAMQWATVC